MGLMSLQSQPGEFRVADLDRGLVVVGVQGGLDDQTRARRGVGDEADDRLMADQRPPAPVLRDETEQAMFDLVPLAGARREMADRERRSQLIGQGLQRHLPQPRPVPVAAPPSAVMSSSLAPGKRSRPISCHQRRMLLVANCAVS